MIPGRPFGDVAGSCEAGWLVFAYAFSQLAQLRADRKRVVERALEAKGLEAISMRWYKKAFSGGIGWSPLGRFLFFCI